MKHSLRAAVTVCVLILHASTLAAQTRATYLYTLSSFAGPLRYDWVRLHVDQERGETYVLYQNLIRIFSPSGMEVFSFGDDLELGHIVDVAVDRNGDIILLSYQERSLVTRCNYRGEPLAAIEITNLPDSLVFHANRMVFQNDLFYFVSLATASVIITNAEGEYQKHVDFLSILDPEERKNATSVEMNGFTVDREGNVFFSMPTLFRVYKYAADGTLSSFGRPGSAAGRFGVIAGVAVDRRGNLLVADKLKCVVMVFDKSFNFVREFGYRGGRPENLIVPDDVAVDGKDRVYISQGRRRGVSVFALTHE